MGCLNASPSAMVAFHSLFVQVVLAHCTLHSTPCWTSPHNAINPSPWNFSKALRHSFRFYHSAFLRNTPLAVMSAMAMCVNISMSHAASNLYHGVSAEVSQWWVVGTLSVHTSLPSLSLWPQGIVKGWSRAVYAGLLCTISYITPLIDMLHNQARKKSTKINFLGPETAWWGGGLPREGVGVENFVPSLESLSSLGFEERNLGYPGNFAGMSRTPGGVQKVCAKKVRAHFSFPT